MRTYLATGKNFWHVIAAHDMPGAVRCLIEALDKDGDKYEEDFHIKLLDESSARGFLVTSSDNDACCTAHEFTLAAPEPGVVSRSRDQIELPCEGSDCRGSDKRVKAEHLHRCPTCGALICSWCIAHCRPSHKCKVRKP